jgi:RNA polymerase sigma factor (sigma-70 family)
MEYHSTSVIPDDQLIQYFLNNDAAALETLVYLNKDKIYKSIFAVVHDKYLADEIFQNVFICIINSLMAGKHVDEGKFLPWAKSIAHNMCIDHLRKIKYTPLLRAKNSGQHEIIKFTQPEAVQTIMNHEQHDEIRKMIDMLPDEEREVIVLRHYADLSFKEIAEVMKCNISTALGRMRYALNNLHHIMKERKVAFNI